MGIGDFLWPSKRQFKDIPCAREAALVAVTGGPCLGAVTLMVKGKPWLSYKVTILSGIALLWITFITCRINLARKTAIVNKVEEAFTEVKID